MKCVTLLGVGMGNPGTLTVAALDKLRTGDIIIGAQRLLDELPADCCTNRVAATRPEQIAEILSGKEWQNACVALSGDTGFYSGAKRLLDMLDGYDVDTIPGISSVQYFSAKLGMPWQDWRFASAHGLELDIAAELSAAGKLFLVTGGGNSVGALCARLAEAGLGEAHIYAGERLSYPDENISQGSAAELAGRDFDPLSVMLAVYEQKCIWPYANAGIPDDDFIRGDVPMTKQEVRAAAIAKLGVGRNDVIYDIGAGTGSVSVEMALLAKSGRVYAIEHKQEAVELIQANMERFGLTNLHPIHGDAPDALGGLPAPDAAFIGGSGGNLSEIISRLVESNPTVRLCVACITLETLGEAVAVLGGDGFSGFEVSQIGVSRSRRVGGYSMMTAQNPIFLVSAKGAEV